jgi:NO-binding membrane sensor protein with MHYT domain
MDRVDPITVSMLDDVYDWRNGRGSEESADKADVHHFAYGWVNPILAFVLSFLGSLLGLVLVVRSRTTTGATRARWLTLAALAIGGTGIWLMHFMAMLGFDVPNAALRYGVPTTVLSFVIAVVIVALGLYTVGLSQPSMPRILLGGAFTGVGIAAMHYTGMAAMRLAGQISYDPVRVAASVAIAVIAACVALWFAGAVEGATATVGAALCMAVAVCGMHYIGMSAIRVRLVDATEPIEGVSPFLLLAPISVLACVVVSALAFATVGFSVRQEHIE